MILVIEDDVMINNLLCKVLSDNGFETDSAFDGEAGLSKAMDKGILDGECTVLNAGALLEFVSGKKWNVIKNSC